MEETIERGWMSINVAARYAGVNPNVLKAAIVRGELEAYEKEATYRAASTRAPEVRTKREYVDAYIRKHWKRAGAWSYGVHGLPAMGEATS